MQKYQCQIHAYCLMTNHTHLLIQVSEAPLNRIMHNINTRYAKRINDKEAKTGHVFQGRYKAQVVATSDYIKQVTRYIVLNPVKAFMVKNPKDYTWSSHIHYLNKKYSGWLSREFVLSHFDCDTNTAINLYEEYIHSNPEDFFEIPLIKEINDYNDAKRQPLVRSPDKAPPKPNITLDEIISFICEQNHVPNELLRSNSARKELVKCRILIAILAQDLCIQTNASIAQIFNRDKSSFNKTTHKLRNQYFDEVIRLKKLLTERVK